MMNQLFMKHPIMFTPKFVVWITTKAGVVPSPFVAVIYPVGGVTAGRPFKGWTTSALLEGRAARWYGAPIGVFNTPREAAEMAARLSGWFLGTFDSAEIPLPSDEDMPF